MSSLSIFWLLFKLLEGYQLSQTNSGIRQILSLSFFYNLSQNLIGSKKGKQKFYNTFIEPLNLSKVLDFGSGTSEILNLMPKEISYTAIDPSNDYINAASKNFTRKGCKFILGDTKVLKSLDSDSFTTILSLGVIHHLSDQQINDFYLEASRLLTKDGVLLSIDPCFVHSQNIISKLLISYDRGQNVKKLDAYQHTANNFFPNVELIHRTDFNRFPYDHAIMKCSKLAKST